ncbi:MAG: IS5 family transposase [Methylocella sp.]
MRQAGFFDLRERQRKLLATRDFLDRVNRFVAWESFRPVLDKALKRSTGGKGGRPPFDAVLMFKVLVLQALYNLSDEQTEYQILDRQSFMMFLGLEMCDDVPDARTIWLFREILRQAGAVERLFARFDGMLNAHGFEASGGQIVDATFVEAPRQRNSRDDNAAIKDGKVPEDWSDKKKAHKDADARWTKKNGVVFYGYKNHANADRKHKLIRKYKVTDASVHDSQELDDVLDPDNDSQDIWADSAYRSEEQEQRLKEKNCPSHIHERAYRNKPLTPEQEAANTERSRARVRVEHVFGHMATAMNGCYVHTIGIARARTKIGLENIAYNISRFTFLMGAHARGASA